MRLTWIAAAAAAATGMAVPAIAGGEWPDGPNKLWFEGLQRPDNHLNPSRKIDQKSLFCCGIADPDHAPDGNAYLFVMYVGSKHDLSSPGFDEIICFVRHKGGL